MIGKHHRWGAWAMMVAIVSCTKLEQDPAQTTDTDASAAICAPGAAQDCPCPTGGQGKEFCNGDGSAFGPCQFCDARTDAAPLDTNPTPKDSGADTSCSLGGFPECNPRTNCGCAKPNEKCDWSLILDQTIDGPLCRKPGTSGTGAPCTSTLNCDANSTCFFNRCKKKTCFVAGDCGPSADWACPFVPAGYSYADGGVTVGGQACAERCDLASSFSCSGGDSCLLKPFGATGFTICGKSGTTPKGKACGDDTECQPGHFCRAAMTGGSVCWRWCKPMAASTGCTAPDTCQKFSDGAYTIVNGVEYGVCAP